MTGSRPDACCNSFSMLFGTSLSFEERMSVDNDGGFSQSDDGILLSETFVLVFWGTGVLATNLTGRIQEPRCRPLREYPWCKEKADWQYPSESMSTPIPELTHLSYSVKFPRKAESPVVATGTISIKSPHLDN